jgi:hypothetical protein
MGTFRRSSDSGYAVTFHFCSECGSNLWWVADRLASLVGVAAGSFADRNFLKPALAVWDIDQHSWLQLPADLPSHARGL